MVVVFVVAEGVFVVVFVFGSAGYGSVGKDRGKFFGEECGLIAEVGGGFENDDQSV